MDTITFKVKSTAALQTLHVAPAADPVAGQFVPLTPDEGGRVGQITLPPGQFVYMLVLRGGQPGSAWGMSVQRESLPSVPRAGFLDSNGDGGDVGLLTVQ